MDHLPAEIKSTIAFDLLSDDPADAGIIHIKQLRLVNKDFAMIAAEPLFSEVYLILKSESFERMRHVSAHPSYAKLVRSIRYEPDSLWEYGDYLKWAKTFHSTEPCLSRIHEPEWPSEDEGRQGWIRYEKEHEEYNARVVAATPWLLQQYNTYQTALQDQELIRQRDYNHGPFTGAMAQLPNLEQVILNFQCGIMERTKALKTSFPVNGFIFSVKRIVGPLGVPQLRSILLGAHEAGTKLKVLRCGKIDWRFFQLPEVEMDKMKSALKHLTSLHISMYTGQRDEAVERHTFLKNRRMCQFFSTAKYLRSLNIEFHRFQRPELEYCVGQNIWRHLSTVQLSCLDTSEDALISFLERHAGTLEDLTLCDINLVQGGWISALPRIRDAVMLRKFKVCSALSSDNPRPTGQRWCIDCQIDPAIRGALEENTRSKQLATAIEDCVLNGGDCPLLDHVTYPQASNCLKYTPQIV